MAFQNAEAIQKLYVAFFNRPADYYGLQYWDSVVTAANGNTAAVAAEFSKSKEYTDTFAGMNTRQIINTVYKNLFGRSADEAGLEYWFGEVNAGRVTISNAVTSIAAGAQNADKIAYASKVTAATAFTNALDTTDERLGYAGEKANAVAKLFVAGVTDAATLATAVTPANLDATVNQSIGAGATATTYQLAKGLDNITGTSGNDVIVGSIDTSTGGTELNTLSSIDLINGGAGVDTLKIAHAQGDVTLGSLTNVEVVEITSAAATADGGLVVNSTSVAGVTDLNIVRAAGVVQATAAASTNVGVSLKDVAGISSISVIGGKNVNVAVTDAVSAINVGAGTALDPVGAVTISATGAAAVNNVATTTMGAITVGGGTTINVTQKATVNAAAIVADGTTEKVVQGAVNITASAATTDVVVKADAQISAQSRAAVAGATEVATVKFTALEEGESVTVGGLTFTAAKDLTAAQVAQAFANLSDEAPIPTDANGDDATGDTNGSSVASNGIFSGSLVEGWHSGATSGDTVTFTAWEDTDMADDLESSAEATVTTVTQGVDAVSALNRLGIDTNTVTIAGGAALKTVTVDGYKASTGTAGITGTSNTALTSVTLANGGTSSTANSGSFEIDSVATNSLALNLTAVVGTVSIGAGAKTLNASVTTSSSVTTTIASADTETLNVTGSGNVAGTTASGLAKATAISTSGMTGGTATFTIADGTATSFTGGAASDRVTVSDASVAITKAISLGAGNDRLVLSGNVVVPTATLSGGEGTDQIRMNGASAAALSLNGDFAAKIDGFERLYITDNVTAATTVNMANMDGITYVISNNSTGTAAAATKATFTVNLAGSTKLTGNEDSLSFNGATLSPTTDITTANALALALAGLEYDDWEVTSVSGSTITFTAIDAGTGTSVPTGTVFTKADTDADSVIVQSISASTAGTDTGDTAPALTIDKMVNDGTLELVALGDGVIVKMADATGTSDSFNIVTTLAAADIDFGNVVVAGVETIKINATDGSPTDSSGNVTNTGILELSADKATTVTISGNSHIDLTLGSVTKSVATINASALTGDLTFAASGADGVVAVTVTGGAGNDTLSASVGEFAKADVINGGAGNDVIYAGSNGAKLTGGAGDDIFVVSAAGADLGNKEGNTYSEITDFSAGDLLQLQAFNGTDTADVSVFGKLTATLNETTATFSNFVDAAIKQAGAGEAVWFNYKGDLYVVVDSDGSTDTFENGTDLIVKLTGVNGDNLTFNSDFGTAGLV
ncbi:DUF4214 domain-containing protein [Massilia sp. 9I]|uniref:DUF4214 domain-containing protein n=1 Tax=Massilia sp. 9I TaxID=2653152 RepID=UPI0012F1ABC3|nr:DUF4214 domain-containing protein [Massilia sp. 9I]VXC58190.1 conserved hypothetical protein [Massilia sp. 9I]